MDEDTLETGQNSEEERVLVVIMNNTRDFDIACREGWYRIPVNRAPRQLAADYVAFYQTSVFPEAKWSIRYYAPIKRFRVQRRQQLLPQEPEHPRANDLYYRVEIGPLRALPRPIPSAKLRRITFIPTTLERLLRAEDVRDLWEGQASAQRLWEALQDRGIEAERDYPIREGRVSYCADLAIFCQKGNLAVECQDPILEDDTLGIPWARLLADKGWALLRFTPACLDALDTCVREIEANVVTLGGALTPWPEETEC